MSNNSAIAIIPKQVVSILKLPILAAQLLAIATIPSVAQEKSFELKEATIQENVSIFVKGNRIQSIGRDTEIPERATIIDLSEYYVLPGMFDCHNHLCLMIKAKGTQGLAFGSDIVVEIPGHTRGSAALTLLDIWLDAEVPAPDILRALTTNAAEMLDMTKTRGRILPQMRADIIAVSENPLKNILTLREVKFVMKDGKVYKNLL